MEIVEDWRKDTPGCAISRHFNNAGAALMPIDVIQAINNHLKLESEIGGYEAHESSKDEVWKFYLATSKLIGSNPENIVFTSSATNSFARALSSVPFKRGDKVLIANEDYVSNQLAFLSIQERFGIELLRSPSCEKGGIDLHAFINLAKTHKPVLVSVTHVPTNSGLVQPIEEVGRICNELEIPFLLDACQSAGQLPLDIEKIGCDFLSATFRKFLRGPRGAGFLFVSDRILNKNWYPLFVDMKGANWTDNNSFKIQNNASRFEDWELPYALVMGSQKALDYSLEIGINQIADRNKLLMNYLKSRISEKGWQPLDRGETRCAIMTLHFPGIDPKKLHMNLKKRNINTSVSLGNYSLIDFKMKKVDWALRISPHYYNTESEIDTLINNLEELIKS